MKRVGVIGYPLTHSLSAAIVQAAFEATGVDATYEPWETTELALESRIEDLRGDDVLGANVTIPYKETVAELLDRLDERAEQIGAVNTIAKEDGQLVGYNTDAAGFDRALRDDADFDPKGKRIVVLGAGGAARAVAFALIEARASIIFFAGRTPKRMTDLVGDLRPHAGTGITLTWAQWGDGAFLRSLAEADLLVNCTPAGTIGGETESESIVDGDLLRDDALVFDLVYNPAETPLLRVAKERGLKAVSGLGMLVYQAAESIRLWTGQEAPIDRMVKAGRAALER